MTNRISALLNRSIIAAATLLAFSAVAAEPVTIAIQPKDRRVVVQSPATFTVGAGAATELSYQWYRNGAPVSGATAKTLTLPSATAADNGAKFHVLVTSRANGAPTSATSSPATLTVVTPADAITHRYSFKTDATDSVGKANGTLEGEAAVTNGKVVLNGTRGTYVNLPGGLIAGNESVTFEFWADLGASRAWARVFDQGSTNARNGGQYDLYFSPNAGRDFRLTVMDPQPTERIVMITGNVNNTTNLHVACVLDPGSGFMGIYTNGVLAKAREDLVSLSSVHTNLFYLGKSLFASDAPLNGAIDEFRIYNVALSAAAVAASHAAGPDAPISSK